MKILFALVVVALIFGAIWIMKKDESYSNVGPWYQKGIGFVAFDDNLPNYEKVPDPLTAIGGRKGNYANLPAYGVYDSDVKHMMTGTPQRARATRTILKPEYVGFSANSIVNRNYYDDLYNHVGDRKPNPIFKYITKEKSLRVNPNKYSSPEYSFASI